MVKKNDPVNPVAYTQYTQRAQLLGQDGETPVSAINPLPVAGSSGGAQVNYTSRVDSDGSIKYVGKAAIGTNTSSALWQIQRITQVNNDVIIEWANGTDAFTQIWDNRSLLSYE